MDHVLGERGQLARAAHGLGIDHIGREDLGIAAGGMSIQEEIDHGPFQTGAQAPIDGEAGAGNLGGALEI